MAFGFGFNKQKVLSAAEKYVQQGKLQNAIAEYEKILKNDAKDLTVMNTVGDLYARLGESDKATEWFKSVGETEAWQIFSAAAEALRSKGSLSGAEEVLQRMLKIDPGNTYALLMQGKNQMESGDAEGAITSLQKVADLDSNPEGLRDLLKAYLQ